MAHEERAGPLDDLTIIDCTMAYAGPFGTSLLADLGANVIKVEPPHGDTFRNLPPFPPDYARVGSDTEAGADYGMAFASVNRNKRSICLDLKQADDKEILLRLCEQADAIVENMRAGVMDELGVGYETIRARNPKIVYGACLDVAGQSVGGLVEATGDLFDVAIADIYPGTLMALGLLSAVHRARRTGDGEFFDVAMYDSVMTLIKSHIAAHGLTGAERRPGSRALVPFGLFPTSDGRIAIAAPVERHWELLCEAMQRPDLVTDERTRSNPRRSKNREFTEQQVSDWTSGKSKEEIVRVLGGKVPCGPANTLAEVFADPHVQARDMIQTFQIPGDNPTGALCGNPIKFANTATSLYQRPPRHGEHTDEILAEFGIEPGRSR
jgi:crotonobetainyl-CoA:carnitine CoA-transferase CaiB-like acyl-CoA transferase